jgi:copper chaperone NosL
VTGRARPAHLAVLALFLAACASGPPRPATLDTKNEQCATCRMAVSDARFAAQLVAPGEEPRFFDDLGCLRDWLTGGGAAKLAAGTIAYVADHRTVDLRAVVSTADQALFRAKRRNKGTIELVEP